MRRKLNVTGFQFFILKVGAASLWEVISSKQMNIKVDASGVGVHHLCCVSSVHFHHPFP